MNVLTPKAECECDEDHSVTKLGHSRDCPWFGFEPPTFDSDHSACTSSNATHDFTWATYNDETMSSGVCRCGLREIDYAMARMP